LNAVCVRLAVVCAVCAAQAQTGNPALTIPPVKVSIDIEKQPVEITVSGTATATSSGIFALTLTIDLSDFQQHLTPVLSVEVNRSDHCGERLSVERAVLAPDAPAAVLTANVNYERYACVKALGKQIVKKVVGGRGVIEVSLAPSVADNNISLDATVRKIDADGSLGEVLRSGAVGDSIREEISDSIESAIQKAVDLKALPNGIEKAASLRTVQFVDGGAGKLLLNVTGELRLSAEELRRAVGQ
jgi:hypothetical protein